MSRKFKNFIKNSLKNIFLLSQRYLNLNILPNHFYSQIPNFKELRGDDYWQKPLSMYGVEGANIAPQVAELFKVCSPHNSSKIPSDFYARAVAENGEDGGYALVEAYYLFCFILQYQPKKIIQVGCGVSTSLILQAAKVANYTPEIICVEPYPMPFLKQKAQEGSIRLISEKAQKVAALELADLQAGDFLFVDSTHTVKVGSEVNWIILEVLPRLKPQVFVHFHDIYFPYDYPRNLMTSDMFFWSESTLLHAFLANNKHFSILLSQSMLHYADKENMQKAIPIYVPQKETFGLQKPEANTHFPASTYLLSK